MKKPPIWPGESGCRLPVMPARIARLPKFQGIPVPFYVPDIEGRPDFGAVRPRAIAECHLEKLCWICGDKTGAFKAFVTSASNGITRMVQEPPCHADCAEYTARVAMAASDDVALVWVTRSYEPVPVEEGLFFRMGFPEQRQFWFRGRPAAAHEIASSLKRNIGALRDQALQQGPEAIAAVKRLEVVLEGA